MASKVYFRVDGDQRIGLGHLIRCVALAQMIEVDFRPIFCCNSCPVGFSDDLLIKGWELLQIETEACFLHLLEANDIVVLDGYAFTSDFQKRIKYDKKCKLVCIDDLHDKEFFADLIINHAPGIKETAYKVAPYTQLAMGLDFALLRSNFLRRAKNQTIITSRDKIFVCFGGADPYNLTHQVLSTLVRERSFKRIVVVVGAVYQWMDSLDEFKNYDWIELFRDIGEEEMQSLMSSSDIAIVPSSGVLQEAMACGCMIITSAYVENQKLLLKGYKEFNDVIAIDDFSHANLTLALSKLNKIGMRKIHIDGDSGKRLLRYFNQLVVEKDSILREATVRDLEKTYSWASDPLIRAYSFNKDPITYDTHKRWFLRKIEEKEDYYFIFEYKREIAGSIRLDRDGDKLKISYLLDSSFHGKGLSVILLKKGMEFVAKNRWCNANFIYGDVMKENIASIHSFSRLNFRQDIISEHNIRFYKTKI